MSTLILDNEFELRIYVIRTMFLDGEISERRKRLMLRKLNIYWILMRNGNRFWERRIDKNTLISKILSN